MTFPRMRLSSTVRRRVWSDIARSGDPASAAGMPAWVTEVRRAIACWIACYFLEAHGRVERVSDEHALERALLLAAG